MVLRLAPKVKMNLLQGSENRIGFSGIFLIQDKEKVPKEFTVRQQSMIGSGHKITLPPHVDYIQDPIRHEGIPGEFLPMCCARVKRIPECNYGVTTNRSFLKYTYDWECHRGSYSGSHVCVTCVRLNVDILRRVCPCEGIGSRLVG